MPSPSARPAIVTVLALILGTIFAQTAAAQNYKIDPAHTSVVFHIRHMGISNVAGMFTETGGTFTLDPDPAKMSFEAEIKTDSIFTGQKQRDGHLKSPDFFNAKQFPTITFKSTKVSDTAKIKTTEGGADGIDVTADLTLHGVTKPVTLMLIKGGEAKFPDGSVHFGLTTELTIKRSEFGMTNMIGPVGDDVKLVISFEGVKQ